MDYYCNCPCLVREQPWVKLLLLFHEFFLKLRQFGHPIGGPGLSYRIDTTSSCEADAERILRSCDAHRIHPVRGPLSQQHTA